MQRRQWSNLLRSAHAAAFILLPLLLVTGGLVYLPSTHVALIRLLPAILWVHAVSGIAFFAILLLPLLAILPDRRFAWGDWAISLGVGAGCSVTGIILWRVAWFPVAWRANAFLLHGATAIALGIWGTVHTARHLARSSRLRRDIMPVPLRGVGRREFLRAAAGGTFAAVFASASLNSIVRILANAGTGGAALGSSGWQIYSVTGTLPRIDPTAYRLQVDGLVGRPRAFTLAELEALAGTQEFEAFQCVTGWVVPDVAWHGVDLGTLLTACGGGSGAYLTFHSADGAYVDSLTMAQATDQGTLLAYRMNGAPLPSEHGGPLRLVVPSMYGYKSVKWVARIRVENRRVVGYWEQRGYKVNAYLPAGTAAGDVKS